MGTKWRFRVVAAVAVVLGGTAVTSGALRTAGATSQPVSRPPLAMPLRAGTAPSTNINGAPIAADFNGDGKTDVLWWQPAGFGPLWRGNANGISPAIKTVLQPDANHVDWWLWGDFNGDRRADIIWYGAGARRDDIWFGTAGGRKLFVSDQINVAGFYEPFVGDFNGDGISDVFWYAPGAAADKTWISVFHGARTSWPVDVKGSYEPIVGDFNGDGKDDIIWYGAGTRRDVMWLGGSSGFTPGWTITLNHDAYNLFVGDVNGDAKDDLVLSDYRNSYFRIFGSTGSGWTLLTPPTSRPGTIPVVGDFNGDAKLDMIMWSGARGNPVWCGTATGESPCGSVGVGFGPNAKRWVFLYGDDFNGDGKDDIYFENGAGPDRLLLGR